MGKKFLITSILFLIASQFLNAQTQEWIIFNRNNSPLPSNSIFALKADLSGNKWIGTLDSGLVKFDGKNWTIYNIKRANFPSNTIYSIAIDNLNNKWVASGNGLIKLNESIEHNNFNIPVDFLCVAIDKLNNKWIGTGNPILQQGAGLIKFDGTIPAIFNKSNSNIPSDFVFSIAIDSDNKKWIGTNSGLAIFDDNNWTIFNKSNSQLPSDFIFFIYIDRKNNKWIGTGYGLIPLSTGGLVKYDGTNWIVYNSSNSNLPSNFVTCAAEDKAGNLWFGTWDKGLVKYNGSSWTSYNTSNSQLPNNTVMTLFIDESDNKWIGTYGGGLAVFRENGVIISVKKENNTLPDNYELKQNYPNPFNAETIIEFSIPKNTHVKLKIYDLLGREIATLIDEKLNAGSYKKTWSAYNLSSSVYLYKLETDEYNEVKKLVLLK